MADTYLTSAGDMLDAICAQYYGATTNRVVEQVLEANAGLADYGPTLPAGLQIALPDIAQPAQQEGVKLWD
jgi:phage tail protein X